jgi:hypothetical protein
MEDSMMLSVGKQNFSEGCAARHPQATSTLSLFDVLPQWYDPIDASTLRKISQEGVPPADAES